MRNCAQDSDFAVHQCSKSGPHVHLNDNVRYLLANREKYFKPLQDKGIKVLLGLLGDHDGIGFGTMNDTQRTAFIADMKSVVEANGLDGVDFDDEWASKEDTDNWTNNNTVPSPNSIWAYPISSIYWPFTATVYRNPSLSHGIDGIVANNGVMTAPSETIQNEMWLASGVSYYKTLLAARQALGTKIITAYEYNTARYITPNGAANGEANLAGLKGAVDMAMQPWYQQYIDDSANGLERARYSPFAMDLGGNAYTQGGVTLPPIKVGGNAQEATTISSYATRFKQAATGGNPYGLLFFYALNEGTKLLKEETASPTATVTKEEYISKMTEIVFGQKTVLVEGGGNHLKDW
jgi:hypothetical protein